MTTVFISGSMRIKKLDVKVLERLDNIIALGHKVIVGDADGVDSSIQDYFKSKEYLNAVVYCTGDNPRNNLASWPTNNIYSKYEPGTRAYFTEKDLKMADDCDLGLMVWDTKSTGTLSNTIELLSQKKVSLVFINKEKIFHKVKTPEDLELLIKFMSPSAYEKADKKLSLQKKVATLKHEQGALF